MNTSFPVQGLKIEMRFRQYAIIGLTFRHNSYDYKAKNGNYGGTTYPLLYHDRIIDGVRGEGVFHVKSNSLILNIKRFARLSSIAPFGFYRDFQFGLIKNEISIDKDYVFFDENSTTFRLNEEDKFPMSQLLFGCNLGKMWAFNKSGLMFDWSFGICFKIRTTSYSQKIYTKLAERASKLMLSNHLFNLKLGLVYAF